MGSGRRFRVWSFRLAVGATTGLGLMACVGVAFGIVTLARRIASTDPGNVYRFGARSVEFLELPQHHLLISKSCSRPRGELACRAYDAFLHAPSFRTPASDPPGNAIRICRGCGGHRIHGSDNHENEVDFCGFSDGSMIDLGSLYGAARHERE